MPFPSMFHDERPGSAAVIRRCPGNDALTAKYAKITRMQTVRVDGRTLSIEDIELVAHRKARAVPAAPALAAMRASRAVVERLARGQKPVYGVNTGFGNFCQVKIDPADLARLQLNLLRSHAAGVGEPLSGPEARAMILLRANVLLTGASGVRPIIARRLLELLEIPDAYPAIPSKGSVGASGDLAPLAHLALLLIGEGELFYNRKKMPAGPFLRRHGFRPVTLACKEGLALINGTQASTAVGSLALALGERLVRASDLVAAMTIEALRGSRRPFDSRLQALRPHPGQVAAAAAMRRILARSEIEESHQDCGKVQDSYSLRCIPQVHGAVRDCLRFSHGVLAVEINSSTDNPTVLMPDEEMISGGNFHGEPVAFAMDILGMALADLTNISERRTERLVNADLSHLPAFLIKQGGLNSGFMMAQVTQAALASENKILAHPASVDTIPTSANQEDHVSMCTIAARKARAIAENCLGVLAIELLAAAQALDFLRPLRSSPAVEEAHATVRRAVPFLDRDRPLHRDIEAVVGILRSGELLHLTDALEEPPRARPTHEIALRRKPPLRRRMAAVRPDQEERSRPLPKVDRQHAVRDRSARSVRRTRREV